MRKNELKNGMIVKSSGGRYGVVCIKDMTDSNCIKFFYDPLLMINHGSVEKAQYGDFIVSLDEFSDELQIIVSAENAKKVGLDCVEGDTIAWSIDKVFSLKEEWTRS